MHSKAEKEVKFWRNLLLGGKRWGVSWGKSAPLRETPDYAYALERYSRVIFCDLARRIDPPNFRPDPTSLWRRRKMVHSFLNKSVAKSHHEKHFGLSFYGQSVYSLAAILPTSRLITFFTHLLVACLFYDRWRVTRVGDTRGGNWGCHPSISSWKTWRPFLVASSAVSPLFIFSWKTDDLFCSSLSLFYFTRGGPLPLPLVTPLFMMKSI